MYVAETVTAGLIPPFVPPHRPGGLGNENKGRRSKTVVAGKPGLGRRSYFLSLLPVLAVWQTGTSKVAHAPRRPQQQPVIPSQRADNHHTEPQLHSHRRLPRCSAWTAPAEISGFIHSQPAKTRRYFRQTHSQYHGSWTIMAAPLTCLLLFQIGSTALRLRR